MFETKISSAVAQQQALLDPFFLDQKPVLADFATSLTTTFQNGGRLFLIGSGPFAAIAALLGQQFLHRQTLERPPLPAMALTHDAGLATFLLADEQGSQLFSRQLRALAGDQDTVLLLAGTFVCSAGREALATARQIGCRTALICAEHAEIPDPLPELLLLLPTDHLPRLLEGCLFAGHLLCSMVEGELFGI
ncbi:MAG: SIS domain-containing protein [Deltaproteobacteria bacterium]|nr:MAG: SIS domain-containing protein [Deltaproteobacteria bacterium]